MGFSFKKFKLTLKMILRLTSNSLFKKLKLCRSYLFIRCHSFEKIKDYFWRTLYLYILTESVLEFMRMKCISENFAKRKIKCIGHVCCFILVCKEIFLKIVIIIRKLYNCITYVRILDTLCILHILATYVKLI